MKDKPNIVIIITDQQASTMMGCAGNQHVRTPNIDRLAREGVRFSRTACANPVCVPSRFSLFTGHLPGKIGLRCNDTSTMPPVPSGILQEGMGFILRRAGYGTYFGGKEHFPRFASSDIGFEYFCKDERGILANEAARFLLERHDVPFVLVVSFINPHDVCYMAINDFKQFPGLRGRLARRQWLNHVELKNVTSILRAREGINVIDGLDGLPPLPPNHQPQENEPEAVRSLFKREFRKHARDTWDERKWRLHRYLYARLTEMVDEEIGTVLGALDSGPNARNTVVIFTSDHGDHDGAHKLEHKTASYSEAVEVPFIIRWNDVLPCGSIVNQTINNGLDLLPTVCDLAGIPTPAGLHGRSILPIASGTAGWTRAWVPVESEVGRALWSDSWAYVLYSCSFVGTWNSMSTFWYPRTENFLSMNAMNECLEQQTP